MSLSIRSWPLRRAAPLCRYFRTPAAAARHQLRKKGLAKSGSLLTLLKGTGHAEDIPETPAGKVDLSYQDPLAKGRPRGRGKRRDPVRVGRRPGRVSLKSITMRFIHHLYNIFPKSSLGFRRGRGERAAVDEGQDLEVVQRVFTGDVLQYLGRRGYTPEDVLIWMWVLTAKDGPLAVLRLGIGTRVKIEDTTPVEGVGGKMRQTYRIPPFLILFTLRRKHFSCEDISILFPMVESALLHSNPLAISEDKSILVLLIRLLRRVREVWPLAIPLVAQLLVTHFHPKSSPPPPPSSRQTRTYNRLLALFSYPTPDRPFAFVPLLQRSQFLILRKMAAMNVPIVREGYRAIISVQLAIAKTPAEKVHARNMVSNWPPWQREKDGWEAINLRHGDRMVTRAGEVLRQMTEAGYPRKEWEGKALVLSGRDTDDSPTIQTRSFLLNLSHLASENPAGIWAARVRATRTVQEAWAIFLQYQESLGARGAPHRDVWEELFLKVLWSERVARRVMQGDAEAIMMQDLLRHETQQRLAEDHRHRVVPGDAKEVDPPPRNPSDGIYIPIPPPSINELFLMMRRDNVTPSPRLISLLIRDCRDISQAQWFLRSFHETSHDTLVTPPSTSSLPPPPDGATTNPQILTAYITLLQRETDAVEAAIRILLCHRPTYTPAWNAVLTHLSRSLDWRPSELVRTSRTQRVAFIWKVYTQMRSCSGAHADSETLRALCVTAEKNLRLALGVTWSDASPVDQVISIFESLVFPPPPLGGDDSGDGGRDGDGDFPRLPPFLLPNPSAVHAYARVLGFAWRYDDTLRLVQWILNDVDWLNDEADKPMVRRILVAVRVFLEAKGPHEHRRGPALEKARDMVGLEEWPKDDEVLQYRLMGGLGRGRFKKMT